MAMMNCPECNKEISDNSTVCIHCGYPVEKILANLPQSDGFVSASNQYPTTAGQKQVTSYTRWLYPVVGLVVLLMVGAFGWYSYANQQTKQARETYQVGANNLITAMLENIKKAEKMNKLNIIQWHYAIEAASGDYVDFSTTEKYVWDPKYVTAFLKMAAAPDIAKKRKEIASETLAVQSSLQTLLPTADQTATHQKLLQLYAFYVEYTSLADPVGSYTSYTEQEATSKASFFRIVSELKIELTTPESVVK